MAIACALCAGACSTSPHRPLAGGYDFRTDVRTETLAKPLTFVSTRPSPERAESVTIAVGPVQTLAYGERRHYLWLGFVGWEPFTLKRAVPPRLRLVDGAEVLAELSPLAVDETLQLSRPPYSPVPAAAREQYYEIDAGTLAALLGRPGMRVEIADGRRDWLPFATRPAALLALDQFIETHVQRAVAAR
jgi:hypothetical protein